MRLKLLIFVEHDVVVRHFLHSGAFAALAARHDCVFVFPERGHPRVAIDVDGLSLGGRTVRLPVAQARLRLWKWLFLADMLRWRPGRHWRWVRRFRRRAVGVKAAALLSLAAQPGLFALFRAWVHRRLAAEPNRALEALLGAERPDLLIHPSVLDGVYINDLVETAGRRQLPLVVIMNSWDNPSTKRAAVGAPDWLLVWGPQTREHARWFMGLPAERAVVFGAAQFDVYRQPPRLDRAAFCRRHAIDPRARVLLYAGASKGTDEFADLVRLDEAIARGALGDLVVVYRPHPWGDGGRGGERILDHPWRHVRLESTMRGYLAAVQAGDRSMSTPDYRDTHDVLSAIDALVSPLSTMLLEAALHGKPALCYLPDDEAGHYRLARSMVHFQELFAEPAFQVARGTGSLVDGVRGLMEEAADPTAAERYRRAAQKFVTTFDRPYAERLADFIEERVPGERRRAA